MNTCYNNYNDNNNLNSYSSYPMLRVQAGSIMILKLNTTQNKWNLSYLTKLNVHCHCTNRLYTLSITETESPIETGEVGPFGRPAITAKECIYM